MDGDVAPLDAIIALCRDTGALLVLDEAHAVLGPEPDLDGVDAVRVGTLSKTHGALGGFAATTARLRRSAREPGPQLHLHHRADAGRHGGRARRRPASPRPGGRRVARATAGATSTDPTRATRRRSSPWCAARSGATLDAADALLERGLLVPAIRPPTVAARTSRLPSHALRRPHRRAGRPARRRAPRAPARCDRPSSSSPAPGPRSARPGGASTLVLGPAGPRGARSRRASPRSRSPR